ncbi:MAG: hypothetical protein R2825_11930 [Saprospiraceae bacterium]
MKKSMKTTGHSNPSIANFQTFEISISQQQSVKGGGTETEMKILSYRMSWKDDVSRGFSIRCNPSWGI